MRVNKMRGRLVGKSFFMKGWEFAKRRRDMINDYYEMVERECEKLVNIFDDELEGEADAI